MNHATRPFGRPVDRARLTGASPDVAPRLLNLLMVSTVGGVTVSGRITEVEAYTQDDPASHTFGGRTRRNATMFGRAGHLYVYLSYGIHRCANIVTGVEGRGDAVLIRSLEIVDGHETVVSRRGPVALRNLTDGPGKLCQGLGIALEHDAVDLCSTGSPIRLLDDGVDPPGDPLIGPRIGISRAVDTPWRFRTPMTS